MKPLKCYVFSLWCLWNGHERVPGFRYSIAYGEHIPVTCCKHCHKVL
jgi:hypothetical protein